MECCRWDEQIKVRYGVGRDDTYIAARLGYSVLPPGDMSFFCNICYGDVLIDLTVLKGFVRSQSRGHATWLANVGISTHQIDHPSGLREMCGAQYRLSASIEEFEPTRTWHGPEISLEFHPSFFQRPEAQDAAIMLVIV